VPEVSWLKLDDDFASHPKVVGLSDKAFRLHICALAYCGKNLTDGLISRLGIRLAGANADLDRPGTVAKQLVSAGLWHANADGTWQIHDYLDYNPSADDIKAERKSAAARMRALRASRYAARSAERYAARSGTPSRTTSKEVVKGRTAAPTPDEAAVGNGASPAASSKEENAMAVDVVQACRNIIAGHGWDEDYSEQAMRDDFARALRSTKTTGELHEPTIEMLIEEWNAERAKRYPEVAA
jgi:hypothetical protein